MSNSPVKDDSGHPLNYKKITNPKENKEPVFSFYDHLVILIFAASLVVNVILGYHNWLLTKKVEETKNTILKIGELYRIKK